LDTELDNFIRRHVPSVEHLEVLLLVSSSPEHWWTARAVNDLLRSNESAIRWRLKELSEGGVLDKAQESYRLKEGPELRGQVERLRTAYKNFRVRVIETIYAARRSPVTEFSRAYDLKRADKQ